ncbi:uncharacterized protein DDB_G0283697 [Microplitis demolitor]|uniref:uncharacterized protein DDB_G0283697 n=1 Tax=Microplitis demolitor TaxID=69319 RepID=UPI0004CDAB28|nr:uncharacterized protein DDB_G0283697 [Microplitis demolitor]
MNNPHSLLLLSPIILSTIIITVLSSLIIDTHARYHHTDTVIPRRHRHRHLHIHQSPNSVSHRHDHEKKIFTTEDNIAYDDFYEDTPEDDTPDTDEDYDDYELARTRQYRHRRYHPRYINHRYDSRRLPMRSYRRFYPRSYDSDYNYYDDDYNYDGHIDELEYRRLRKDFARNYVRKNFRRHHKRRHDFKKIPDDDYVEDDNDDDDKSKKKVNVTDKEEIYGSDDKEEKEEEEDEIWKEVEEEDKDDDEDDDDEDDDEYKYKSFDDIIKSLKDDKSASVKREYRNIEINRGFNGGYNFSNRGDVRREFKSPSVSGDEFSKKGNLRGSLKIRVRDEDYDRKNFQSDNGEEAEEEEETSAPVTTSAPKSTTMMSTAAVSSTGAALRPVIISQTYERRDSRFSDPTSSGFTPLSHAPHKVPVKEIKSLQNNNNSNNYNSNKSGKSAEIREALQHAMKVSREGSCQWPRARVIPVRDVYPNPSTTYIPHCAILHRCSDDTGCCRSESLTCVPKQSHKVELYFYTTSIGGGSVVEKLSFYNHTECECREKSEYGMQSDNKLQDSNEFKSQVTRQNPSLVPQNIRKPVQKKPCRCPSEFTPRMNFDGECVCDCFENDQDCDRARRGKGYFSLRDRLCIQNEECAMPSCEFGDYIKRQGRCPRKKEKFDEIANFPNHMNYHNRHRS